MNPNEGRIMRRTIAVLTLVLVGVGVPVLLNASAAQQITAKDVQPVHREGASDEQVRVAAETISERKYPVKLDHGRKLVEKKDEVTVRENVGGHHKHPPEPVTEVAVSSGTTSTTTSDATGSITGSNEIADIIECESGSDYSANTGNGYTGAGQWLDSTWQSAGGSTESAYQASPEEQDRVMQNYIDSGHRSAFSC